MTVTNVTVIDVKSTELNFTLAPVISTTTNPPEQTTVLSPMSNPTVTTPDHQAIQPQEFRHHNDADMDLFLRKYSSEYPTITHLHSVGHSVQDRELYVMIISDNPTVHEHGVLCTVNKFF